MFAFHHPGPRWVASHAITHIVKSGSPKSLGTSCASPRASGHVSASVNDEVARNERGSAPSPREKRMLSVNAWLRPISARAHLMR